MTPLYQQARREFGEGAYRAALATLSGLLQAGSTDADVLILAASIQERLGQPLAAAALFEAAIEHTPTHRLQAGFCACRHYLDAGQDGAALRTLSTLFRFLPEDVNVNHSLCSLLREAGRYQEALPYAETLARIGTDFDNWLNAGMVLLSTGSAAEALGVLKAAYAARPGERLALTELFWCALHLCDFDLAEPLQAELLAAYEADGASLDIRENVFRSLQWSGDEAYHVLSALRTAEVRFGRPAPRRPYRPVPGRRLRIGYLSSDFYSHATMMLFAGTLEGHDRSRFEVFGLCHTPQRHRHGPMRQRFLDAVERYVDLLPLDDDQAAATIRALDLDMLIDLKGFTADNRLGIFCRRPAPVQVTYLGFPGSVAGVGIDYAITDGIVTPAGSEPLYAETLVRLPDSYQANDRSRPQVMREGPRGAHGLPETGVVFAAFNQPVKIRATMFRAWMAILAAVEGSVLWLGPMPAPVQANLLKAAAGAGVAPDRLVFAQALPVEAHLKRLCHADIALDTAPYNGHTTTSDALWAGVPVITLRGTSFAGRVAESLLSAVGLPELVAEDLPAFGRMAVDLAQDGVRQSRLRQHLLDSRATAPLFDTGRFNRQFEAALEEICRHAADLSRVSPA